MPERRADRQVDVAGDDDQRLADGDQDQDGGVQQQVLDALLGQERAVARLGDGDHHQEDEQDGEFAELADAVDEAGRRGLLPGRRRGSRGRAAVTVMRRLLPPSRWPPPSRTPRWPRARGISAVEPPLVHDEDPVGHAEDLRQVGGDHQDRDARRRRVRTAAGAPRPWCRRRCRGSARRRSAPGPGGEPLGEDDLLLVAAGQGADRVGDPRVLHLQPHRPVERSGCARRRGPSARRGAASDAGR